MARVWKRAPSVEPSFPKPRATVQYTEEAGPSRPVKKSAFTRLKEAAKKYKASQKKKGSSGDFMKRLDRMSSFDPMGTPRKRRKTKKRARRRR